MKKALIAIAVLIVGLLVVIAMQPATFELQRSVEISAPAEVPFALVADFHEWAGWSPWEKLDPDMKKTYEGTAGEVGSSYAWVGNEDVGSGKMTLTAVEPSKKLDIQLEFLAPFEATNQTLFTFVPAADATTVTWKMTGELDFMSKAFHLFADMDAMVGGDFEKGLAQLKSLAEAKAQQQKQEVAVPAEPAKEEETEE